MSDSREASSARLGFTARVSRFKLDTETEDQLLSLFRDSPHKLERLQGRIRKAKQNSIRIQELQRRKQLLLEKNRVLLETTAADEEASTKEVSAVPSRIASPSNDSAVNAGPTPSSAPYVSPTPSTSLAASPLASDFGVAKAAPSGPPVPHDWSNGKRMYQYCGPKGVTGVVSAVFADGQLFRIITEKGEWAFYNDTRSHDMHVRYIISEKSTIQATRPAEGESAKVSSSRMVTRLPNGQWDASVIVPPEETVALLSGTVAAYEDRSKAVVLPAVVSDNETEREASDHALCSEAWNSWVALQKAASECSLPMLGSLAEDGFSRRAVQASEAVLDACMQNRIPFVDPSFFPSSGRLCRAGVDAFHVPPLHWRTPHAILPPESRGEERLFIRTLAPHSVCGGKLLPNQNFLSVVAAMVETPSAVRLLFTHPEAVTALLDYASNRRRSMAATAVVDMEQMLGAFRVQICLSGWWHSLLVDAHLPASECCPEFARCRDDLRALWLPLLEKAYAKAFGSYAATVEASVPDVVANLTGSLCCPLSQVWPSDGSDTAAQGKAAAFAKLVRRHVQQRGGKLLFRTFPLSLAKSKGKRDRLEEIYETLGLVPGSTVLVRAVEELSSGETVVHLRQNTPTCKGKEACLAFWRRLGKTWVDTLWEVEFGREATGGGAADDADDSLWMDLADVPQFFQEGFCVYPTVEWTGGEVRARGTFSASGCVPSTCMKLEVSEPTTVILAVTQAEQRLLLSHRRLRDAASPLPDSRRHSTSLSAVGEGPTDVRGVALQIIERRESGHVLRGCSSASSPDIYSLGEELQYTFQREAGVGMELLPENSPYYVIPRVSPLLTASSGDVQDTPYVLSVAAKTATIGQVSGKSASPGSASPRLQVSFVEISSSSPVLKQTRVPRGGTVLSPSADVKEVAAEYQTCHKTNEHRIFVHNKRIDVV